MSNIKIVKHISGLEIIGEVEELDGKVSISKGFSVLTQQIRATEFGLAIVPLCVAAEDSNQGLPATFDRANLIGVYDPNPSMRENYQRQTGAIITPPTPRVALKAVNHNKHP